MRQIALLAAVRGITGRLPILILFSSNFARSLCGGELEGARRGGGEECGDSMSAHVLIEVR